MREIKRILWVDDYADNKANKLFKPSNTKIVRTMDEALDEISGEYLYEYDLVVLDIDFEQGISDSANVVKKLRKSLYLDDIAASEQQLIKNGGYLIYLYLLKQGFPSDRVAFLTGNPAAMIELDRYARELAGHKDSEEIVDILMEEYKRCDDDQEVLTDALFNRGIPDDYIFDKKDGIDIFQHCWKLLTENDEASLRDFITKCEFSKGKSESELWNTGDEMIYRFHKANLEAPAFFAKNDQGIMGCGIKKAREWINNRSGPKEVARWLILNFCEIFFHCYKNESSRTAQHIRSLFYLSNTDGSAICESFYEAFSKLPYMFRGLTADTQKGVYLQGISTVLLPFDHSLRNTRNTNISLQGHLICTRAAKLARNYTMHNLLGAALEERDMLFILLLISFATLPCREEKIAEWRDQIRTELNKSQGRGLPELLGNERLLSLKDRCESAARRLYENGHLSRKVNLDRDYNGLPRWDDPYTVAAALGGNISMDTDHETDEQVRRRYYMFVICAYIANAAQSLGNSLNRQSNDILWVFRYAANRMLQAEDFLD